MSLLPLLAGCTVGPDFLRPQHSSGNAYAAREGDGGTEKPLESQQRFVMGEKLTGSWWQLFRSPELNQLIEHAIAGNRNLAAARATMAQARELVDQAGGARYPQFSLGGDGRRSHSNYAASGFDQSGPTSNLFGVGPNLSYALDLFGGLARQEERQGALADFQEHQLSAAYLTLTGNSVAQAIQSASIAAQIKTVEEIVRQDEQNLESVRKLFRVQEATKIDVQSAESQVATSRTLLPPLRQQLSASRHALAVLVGKAAHDWTPPQFELDRFTLPAELPASLPSELLRQRPDVLAAEAQLHAASAGVGVATAQLYPNITLSASMAQQALSPTALFGAAANIWSLASNLTAPIFNGGALMAQKRAAEDAFQASLANYEQTVLTSFSQVADLMDALVHDAELVEAQRRAVESSRASVRLTRDSFAAGEARLIQVLDAERLYGQARLGYVRAVAQRYVDTSQFFIAMGGGWWDWKERTAALPPR